MPTFPPYLESGRTWETLLGNADVGIPNSLVFSLHKQTPVTPGSMFAISWGRSEWHRCVEVVDMSFGTTRHLCHYKVLDFGRLADVKKLWVWCFSFPKWCFPFPRCFPFPEKLCFFLGGGLAIRDSPWYPPLKGVRLELLTFLERKPFSDLGVGFFVPLNFWWCRDHPDDSQLFLK